MDRMVVNGNTFSQTQAPFCVSDVLVDEDNHCVGVDVILLGDRKIPKDLGNVEIVKSDTDFHFSILFNSKTKREIVGMQSINNAFFEDQFGNWLMVIEVGEFGKTISNQLKRIGSSHTVI